MAGHQFLDHFFVISQLGDLSRIVFKIDALGQAFAQMHLPATQAGTIGNQDVFALEIAVALDILALAQGQRRAAELIEWAVGAFDQAGRHAGNGTRGFQFGVVAGIGDEQVDAAISDGLVECGITERDDQEVLAGQVLAQVVGVGLPFLTGLFHTAVGEHPDTYWRCRFLGENLHRQHEQQAGNEAVEQAGASSVHRRLATENVFEHPIT